MVSSFFIGKLLRFTFDVLVYLITLGYHRYKLGGSHSHNRAFALHKRMHIPKDLGLHKLRFAVP
jgi:hypothetical protein